MTKNLVIGFLDYLKTQGVTYQCKNITPDGAKVGQSSTGYAVSIEAQVIMNLILSVSPRGLGKFQIALTTAKVDTLLDWQCPGCVQLPKADSRFQSERTVSDWF